MEVGYIRSRHFYNNVTSNHIPAAVTKWESYDIQPSSWSGIFEIPYKCTTSTRLQSLHYRIVHRFIPTRKYLSTRGIPVSPLCHVCDEIDDLKHFFFDCVEIKPIWDKILPQLKTIFGLADSFTSYKSVVLGCLTGPPVVNLIMLLIKQQIVSRRCGTTDSVGAPHINNVKATISRHEKAERLIAQKRNKLEKHEKKWEKVLDAHGNLALGEM